MIQQPAIWKVMHQATGACDAVLLGDQPGDSFRVGLTIVGMGDESPEVDAQIVYPCRKCGWENACYGGEECHS